MSEIKNFIFSKELKLFIAATFAIGGLVLSCISFYNSGIAWQHDKNTNDLLQDKYIAQLQAEVVDLKNSRNNENLAIALLQQNVTEVKTSQDSMGKTIQDIYLLLRKR